MIESNPQNANGKKSDPTLRDLLLPLFRRKRVVVLSFCGTLLGAILAAVLVSHQYKATMEILVNQKRLDPAVSPESTMQTPVATPPVTEEDINSEVELLQSPELLQQVVIANGLQERERKSLIYRMLPKRDDAWYIAKATDHLGRKVRVEVVTKTNMIEVIYKSSDPYLAYGVLKELSNQYLAKHLAVRRPQGSYVFFNTEANKYRQALADSETRLADFGKASGDTAPDVERTDMAQQVVNAVAALQETQRAIAADKYRIEDEEVRMKATPERSPTQQMTVPAQTLLQQLRADLLAAQTKKTQLLMKYDPSYPMVQEAEQEINQTQSAIADATKEQFVNQTTDRDPTYELIREDIVRTKADLAFQQASARALEINISNLRNQMVDLNQKVLMQADLEREVKANEANYLLYLSKRELERTSDALDDKRISNVALAVPPMLPVLPATSPGLVIIIGFIAAVFVGIGAAFVAEYTDPSLRTANEVVEVLRIPVLASVPKQTA
jgi:uncharacterized protein involved in exopolysaccharide biosynthesis